MTTHEVAHLLRHGEGDQEVISGKQFFQLGVHPCQGLAGLTGGTVTIAASAMNIMGFAVLFTLIHGEAMDGRAAAHDGFHGLAMRFGHPVSELFQIGRAMSDKNVLYGADVEPSFFLR